MASYYSSYSRVRRSDRADALEQAEPGGADGAAAAAAEGAMTAGDRGEGAAPYSDADVEELLSSDGAGSAGRSGRSGGRRNRIHPRNWGYTTYLDRVFGMRCFNDLVRMRVFPDAKDISESYGALQAAARYGGICNPAGAALDSRGAEQCAPLSIAGDNLSDCAIAT